MIELPSIYGLEHERRLVADPGGHISDPAVLSQIVLTDEICANGTKLGGFSMRNGSKHYVDSAMADEFHSITGDNASYETATPETTSLRELCKYILGVDRQAVEAIQQYLGAHPGLEAILYNHRASLGKSNTYATHLNYGISHQLAWDFGYERKESSEHFVQSIVNGVVVTGAGGLHDSQLALSQKTDGLALIQGRRGNHGTVFQLPENLEDRSMLQRVELRLADTHPGLWATYIQAGLGGIALAVSQLPGNHLARIFGSPNTQKDLIRQAKRQNNVQLTDEGLLRGSADLAYANDWTLRLAETFLDQPRQGVKGEEDLVTTGQELVAYCDRFKPVLAGESTVHGLAMRGAGWAKRAVHILGATSQKGILDFSRPECLEADTAYDQVRIEAGSVLYGPAFVPDTLPAGWSITEQEVAYAATNPPADTVAAYRVRVLQANRLEDIYALNWSRIHIWQPDGRLGTTYTVNPLNPVDGT